MDNEDFIQNDFGPHYDGLDQIREEKMRFEFDDETSDGTSDDTSDGTSEGTSDGTSEGTSDSSSESGFANAQSDSDSAESDSESESASESSEMVPMGRHQNRKGHNRRGGHKKNHGPQRKHGKKDRRRNKKHQRVENEMESESDSMTSDSVSMTSDSNSMTSDSESMTSDSEIEEMYLPALPEDVKPVDLAYIPRASIDKRHGGRHLHGKKGGKHGKKGGKRGKKGCHKGGKNGAGEGRHGKGGKHHGGKGHHHKGHKMVWCLAIGSILYTALISTFLCIYKKFICAFRSYHNTVALSQQTSNMSVEERNKAYHDMTSGSRCQRKCVKKQVAAPQRQAQYVPPCAVPNLGNDALTQSLIAPPQGAPITAPQPQPQPQMAPHQATYTLEQVKELLALERQRLARQ